MSTNEPLKWSIVVKTCLFEHQEVKPNFINPCSFGEDFATWLRQELLRFPRLEVKLSEPVQEDYGWGLRASAKGGQFWIAISYVGDGPMQGPAEWVISVASSPALNLAMKMLHKSDQHSLSELREIIRQVLASNHAIELIGVSRSLDAEPPV